MAVADRVAKNTDLVVALGMIAVLGVMIVPLPRIVIDFCLTLGITISIVLLLTSIYANRALDFSIFPSLLLITTLFRLSLNVATTRVILLYGSESGAGAAGEIIRSFGEFVVGGNYAVGLVIFIILVGRCNWTGVLPVLITISPEFKNPLSVNISIWSSIISSSVSSSA